MEKKCLQTTKPLQSPRRGLQITVKTKKTVLVSKQTITVTEQNTTPQLSQGQQLLSMEQDLKGKTCSTIRSTSQTCVDSCQGDYKKYV